MCFPATGTKIAWAGWGRNDSGDVRGACNGLGWEMGGSRPVWGGASPWPLNAVFRWANDDDRHGSLSLSVKRERNGCRNRDRSGGSELELGGRRGTTTDGNWDRACWALRPRPRQRQRNRNTDPNQPSARDVVDSARDRRRSGGHQGLVGWSTSPSTSAATLRTSGSQPGEGVLSYQGSTGAEAIPVSVTE